MTAILPTVPPAVPMAPMPGEPAMGADRAGDEVRIDRERTSVGVNDTVIRRLFAVGLDLHSTRMLADEPVRVRLETTISELDAAINELRSLTLMHDMGSVNP